MTKVVEAVGVAVKSENPELGQRVEAEMVKAIKKAQAAGEADPVKIREKVMAARDKALKG